MLTFYSTLKLWDFSKSKVRQTEQVVSNNDIYILNTCIHTNKYLNTCILPTLHNVFRLYNLYCIIP